MQMDMDQLVCEFCDWMKQRERDFKTLVIEGGREDALVELFLEFCHSHLPEEILAFPKITLEKKRGEKSRGKQCDVVIFDSLAFDEKYKA